MALKERPVDIVNNAVISIPEFDSSEKKLLQFNRFDAKWILFWKTVLNALSQGICGPYSGKRSTAPVSAAKR